MNSGKTSSFVNFLGDAKQLAFIDDVVSNQNKGVRKSSRKRSTRAIEKSLWSDDDVEQPVEGDIDREYDVHLTHDESLLGDEDAMAGKALFGFKTPKRKRSSAANKKDDTPDVTSTSAASASEKSRKRRSKRRVEATTPYRLASRMDTNFESDDSIESDGEDSDSSAEVQSVNPADRTSTQHVPSMTDEFFKAQSSKPVTSDHTLARLREDCVLDQASLQDILSSRPNQYKQGMKRLLAEHRSMYRTWMLQMCLGYNLLLYGYGSKKKLLEEFRRASCGSYHCVVVNGFFPSLTLKNILAGITDDCLDLPVQSSETDAIIADIDNYLNKKDEALYIFVHSIDGPMVRTSSVQSALSSLASLDNVHVIASVDHINAPLMWSQSVVTKYRWLWYDATTYEPYLEETSYENSLLTQQSGALALRSMVNVYKSLTPNAKNIFLLMTKYHMDNRDNQSYIGIPFQMLYQKCRENFLVNSDQTLRTQLTEFRDHKLVRSRKGIDGAENIFLSVDCATLSDFMEQVETMDA